MAQKYSEAQIAEAMRVMKDVGGEKKLEQIAKQLSPEEVAPFLPTQGRPISATIVMEDESTHVLTFAHPAKSPKGGINAYAGESVAFDKSGKKFRIAINFTSVAGTYKPGPWKGGNWNAKATG